MYSDYRTSVIRQLREENTRLRKCLELVFFAVTKDAENNGGQADLAAIREVVVAALANSKQVSGPEEEG